MPNNSPILPMDDTTGGKGKLAALVGTAAATLMIATVGLWEGKSNTPYKDRLAYDILTVCYGETRVEMRRYSDAECKVMLSEGLADFAAPVLKRNPELRQRPEMLAAAVSLSYNIGSAAYNRSTVARRFSARNWRGACDAFLMWNKAGGKTIKGLTRRREYERQLCLRGTVG